jgi:predicted lipoprotein
MSPSKAGHHTLVGDAVHAVTTLRRRYGRTTRSEQVVRALRRVTADAGIETMQAAFTAAQDYLTNLRQDEADAISTGTDAIMRDLIAAARTVDGQTGRARMTWTEIGLALGYPYGSAKQRASALAVRLGVQATDGDEPGQTA